MNRRAFLAGFLALPVAARLAPRAPTPSTAFGPIVGHAVTTYEPSVADRRYMNAAFAMGVAARRSLDEDLLRIFTQAEER